MANPHRALRRLVLELAQAPAADVDDILESVDPARRPRLRALLDEYRGAAALGEPPEPPSPASAPPPAAEAHPAPAFPYDVSGLSGELGRRLSAAVRQDVAPEDAAGAADGAADAAALRITPHAMGALREIALRRRRLPAPPVAEPPALRAPARSWSTLRAALFRRLEHRP